MFGLGNGNDTLKPCPSCLSRESPRFGGGFLVFCIPVAHARQEADGEDNVTGRFVSPTIPGNERSLLPARRTRERTARSALRTNPLCKRPGRVGMLHRPRLREFYGGRSALRDGEKECIGIKRENFLFTSTIYEDPPLPADVTREKSLAIRFTCSIQSSDSSGNVCTVCNRWRFSISYSPRAHGTTRTLFLDAFVRHNSRREAAS